MSALVLVAYNEAWKQSRADKRTLKDKKRALKAARLAPSLICPPDPIFAELVSTHNRLPTYSEAFECPNEAWDAFLIQTLIKDTESDGWRVPRPDQQPGNVDVWTVLRRAHQAPEKNIFQRLLKKIGMASPDANVCVSDDEPPYKSKNPYLPRNVYENPPCAHIRTPSGLFVSTARIWEIQYRAYLFGHKHKFEGLEMHIMELERRFREQRLIP